MLKLQNTSLQEIKLQRIQESWQIPSSKKAATMEGAPQGVPSTAGSLEMVGAFPGTGNAYWSLHTSQGILRTGSSRNLSPWTDDSYKRASSLPHPWPHFQVFLLARERGEERKRKVMQSYEVKMLGCGGGWQGPNPNSHSQGRPQKTPPHPSSPGAGGNSHRKGGCSPRSTGEVWGRNCCCQRPVERNCGWESGTAATREPWQGEQTIAPEGGSSRTLARPSLLSNLAVPGPEKSSGNCLSKLPCHPSTDSSGPFTGAKSQNQSPLKSGGKLTWNSMGFA